jgi:hypothetical protein
VNSTNGVVRKPRSNIRFFAVLLLGSQIAASQQMPRVEGSTAAIQFRIPAQPMDRALKEFASQSKLQLIYATDDIVAGTVAHEVSGLYLPEAALAQLLASSCLGYKFVNTHTVAIAMSHVTCR